VSLVLTAAQRRFFDVFGYLRLPGLFADVIERLRSEFDDLVRHEPLLVVSCQQFMDGSPDDAEAYARLLVSDPLGPGQPLHWLSEDQRLASVAQQLLGPQAEYICSFANLYNCNVHWHDDSIVKSAPGRHLQAMLYLDPLDATTGALRVIPGSHLPGAYGEGLRRELLGGALPKLEVYGLPADELPGLVLEVLPGDLLVLDFDVLHASFHGGLGRRLLAVSYGPRLTSARYAEFGRAVLAGSRAASPDDASRSLNAGRAPPA